MEEPQQVVPQRAGGQQIIPRPDRWTAGDEAPWSSGPLLSSIDLPSTLDRVARRGAGRPPTWTFPGARSSAVLIALFDGDYGAEVLLTRRAWHLRSHRGEVCFPGGRQDLGETAIDTALREANEEVQLDPADVTVVGELDQIATASSESVIVPIVAHLAKRPILTPGTSEVDRIFTVPLNDFLQPGTYREERWSRGSMTFPVVFFELDDETVWGATGRMMRDLLLLALNHEASL